jgi:hypothetical protein
VNTLELKTYLINILADFLGEYEVSGVRFPAIWLGTVPHTFVKHGLELIISRAPSSINPGLSTIRRQWNVVLVQNDSPTPNIESALEKLSFDAYVENITYLPGLSISSNDLFVPDQAFVSIKDDRIKF